MKGTIAQNWSYEEFKAMLLIHAALADGMISLDETEHLKDKLGSDTLKNCLKTYTSLSDMAVIQQIQIHAIKYITTAEQKETLIAEVYKTISSDNTINSAEKFYELMIKKLLS